ncbi:hypothetical protein LUZ60_004162 [Juncus effusus]|nr:hypothetical protein LUZ60_004162 [Juncus effusus]
MANPSPSSSSSSLNLHFHSTTTIQDLPNDVLIRVLSLLPASTLACLSCVSSELRALSTESTIWRHLCISTWPSLNHPRVLSLSVPPSFFSDAISSPSFLQTEPSIATVRLPEELISAVDIYHEGKPIFSNLMETDTTCPSFLHAPFRLDALDRSALNAISLDGLTLSWILIDPNRNRAVNLSSQTPVSIDRDLYTAEVLVQFATVLVQSLVSITITCSEKTGDIREVSLTMEDEEGDSIYGEESLVILTQAMEGKRGNRGKEETEGRKRYEEFVRWQRRRKDSLAMELLLDFCSSVFGALVFLFLTFMVLLRSS